MRTSTRGISLIKRFEGCRLETYLDAIGVPTIGYGHITGVAPGMKITQAQADAFLAEDLAKFETAVNKLSTHYNFNQNEFDALVSFAFNCGINNLDKLTGACRRSKGQIADAFLLYNKAGGKVLSGLAKRRQMEKDLFCTPAGSEPEVNPFDPPKSAIKEGSKGSGVKWLQFELNRHGFGLVVDGIAGEKTISALKEFQFRNGLAVDGIAGKITRASLCS